MSVQVLNVVCVVDPRELKRVLHLIYFLRPRVFFLFLFMSFPLYEGAESWPGRRGCNVMWVSNLISSHSQLLLGCVTPTQSRPSVCVCVRLCARDSQASSTGVCTLIELKSKVRKNTWRLILPPSLEVKSRKKEKKNHRSGCFLQGITFAHFCLTQGQVLMS